MRVVEQLHAVEHRAAWHAGFTHDFHYFLFVPLAGPTLDHLSELFDMLATLFAIGETRVVRDFGPPERLPQRAPHLRVGTIQVDIVVRTAGGAFEDIADWAGAEPIAYPRGWLVSQIGAHHRYAAVIEHRLLHRDLDLLALSGAFALVQRRQNAAGGVDASAGISDRRAGLQWRGARKASERHGATARLSDHVEALV